MSCAYECQLLPSIDLLLLFRFQRPVLQRQLTQIFEEITAVLMEYGYDEDINVSYKYENVTVLFEHVLILAGSTQNDNFMSCLGATILRIRQVFHCLLLGDFASALDFYSLLSGHLNNLLAARVEKQFLIGEQRIISSINSSSEKRLFSELWMKRAQELADSYFEKNPHHTKTHAAAIIRRQLIEEIKSDTYSIPKVKEIAEKIKK
ncbi:hypothetical protein RA802_003043 [Vibrio fluvialis]|nr:hypothetical protein [Vibrio fluvialis]